LSLLINGISIVVGVLLNQYLIPIYGINGAALATGGVWLASGIVMAVLIYSVYGMQPVTSGVLTSVALFLGLFLLNHLWKINSDYLLIGSVGKTLLLMGTAMFILLRFRLSDDVYSMAKKMLAPIGIRLKD
jgi:O-antigen/teichoic acid export membrane protein